MQRIVIGILLCLQVANLSSGQNFRGGISGSVFDPTGAAVADAEAKATDSSTGLVYSTLSSTAGEFAFRDLPLGTYNVVVTKPGFQVVRIEGISLSAGQSYALPVHLNIARLATTVEVSAATVEIRPQTPISEPPLGELRSC